MRPTFAPTAVICQPFKNAVKTALALTISEINRFLNFTILQGLKHNTLRVFYVLRTLKPVEHIN